MSTSTVLLAALVTDRVIFSFPPAVTVASETVAAVVKPGSEACSVPAAAADGSSEITRARRSRGQRPPRAAGNRGIINYWSVIVSIPYQTGPDQRRRCPTSQRERAGKNLVRMPSNEG